MRIHRDSLALINGRRHYLSCSRLAVPRGAIRVRETIGNDDLNTSESKAAEFIGCTSVLKASGHGYMHPILVRIEFDQQPDGSVILTSRWGHTGTLIEQAGSIRVASGEWENRQCDLNDSLVLTKWAFSKAGWIYGED